MSALRWVSQVVLSFWPRNASKQAVAYVLAVFVITRAVVLIGMLAANRDATANESFFDTWNRFNTYWYIDIIEHGYNSPNAERETIVFFPLFLILMKGVSFVTGNLVSAGMLINNLAFLLALILLYKLVALEFGGQTVAKRAVFCVAAFPTAFFFSAAYPEGLFLLLTVSAAYCARKRAWTWATVAGALASATRPLGVLVWIVVVFEWLDAHGWQINSVRESRAWIKLRHALRDDFRSLITICLIPAGLLLYMLYLQSEFGNALAFFTAQQTSWAHQLVGMPAVVVRSVSDIFQYIAEMNRIGPKEAFELIAITLLNLITFFAVLITAVPIWRRMGAGYAIYMALSVLIPMSSEERSLARYAMILFPMFIVFAWWGRRRWANVTLLMIFVPLLFFFSTLFFKWVIVG